ncbi:hypothetical protein J3459_006285 [Metarhizium acridum]|uniref:uncharacterized protein n=1 Tax=Metarhizium acridum TaxID=92637 RepID=UPI001C6C021E|nr:hypothetical protein J3458_005515 [Metarhizium acridum]KAG8427878.1 hypothetical protein J3459_006285 [Metarhizium acridum]
MHSDTLLILLEVLNKGFDQGELDKALLLAAENKSEDTVVSLLEFGARSGLQNSEKMTALQKTIQWSNERITKQIVDSQSHLDTKDKQKALLMAAGKGMKDAAEALLKKGAALNLRVKGPNSATSDSNHQPPGSHHSAT